MLIHPYMHISCLTITNLDPVYAWKETELSYLTLNSVLDG
jgi:hypothetical protein